MLVEPSTITTTDSVRPPNDWFSRNWIWGPLMAITGMLMMSRVRTLFFTRNPYLLDDMTWGMVYLLHGFVGVGLIALVTVHVYFALRPEKLPITKAMVFGTMNREYYLRRHDPRQWACDTKAPQ